MPRHARRGSCAVWFVLGAMLGSFAISLYWLQRETSMTQTETPAPAVTQERPPQPKFDFYDLLPEMEVVVPNAEADAAAAAAAAQARIAAEQAAKQAKVDPATVKQDTAAAKQSPTAATAEPPAGQETYLLQLGSFRRAEEAERLKAQLALQGIQAKIQQVPINGVTYHRVLTGPLRGSQQLNEVRGRLRKNGVDTIVIKLKG